MFARENTFDAQSGLSQSEQRYKRNFESYSSGQTTALPPDSPSQSDPEGHPPVTPQRRFVTPKVQSQCDRKPSLSILATGQSAPVNPPPSMSCPPPNPPRTTMAHLADDIKLPIFNEMGSEDPEQFWFLCEAVWNAKSITDLDVRTAQLITSFRDRALTWFMKFSSNQHPTLDEIKAAIIKEFKKPKSESQSITELKEIQQRCGESVWDFDQRFKVLLDQVSFTISPTQHKEWFITTLLPHIRTPLMQQKVADQQEALEIAMKLETAPIGDDSGLAQIQAQLAAMALELRDMKKAKTS